MVGVGLVTGSCHSLFFLLACPFVSQVISFIYDVRVRGLSQCLTRPLILSLCGVVPECLLPCCVVVTAKWVVSCTWIMCFQPLSHFPLSFQKVLLLFSLFSPSFSPCILSFLSLVYWPFHTCLLACQIRAAILYFSCHLHLFTSQCFVIGSPD